MIEKLQRTGSNFYTNGEKEVIDKINELIEHLNRLKTQKETETPQ
jgi:hypothetical protein